VRVDSCSRINPGASESEFIAARRRTVNLVPVKAHLTLDGISVVGNASPGDYTPYLWIVFFKIDGDTAFVASVDGTFKLQGTATVVGTPGNHGDLGSNLGSVSIPAAMGDFTTLLSPIPLGKSGTLVVAPGLLGCIAILMGQLTSGDLETGTPDDDVPPAHEALNNSLQQALNALIPTFSVSNENVTDAEVQAIEKQVESAVTNAVKNALSLGNKILTGFGFEGQDWLLGTAVYRFSGSDLATSPPAGITLQDGYPNPTEIVVDVASLPVTYTFQGTIIADPLPLSMKRVLTRLGQPSLRKAMAATAVPFTPRDSANSWINAVA
jgi:hypothetical protein